MAERVLYRRGDGKWAWRLVANNGDIIATDGGQGYENEDDARSMADRIIGVISRTPRRRSFDQRRGEPTRGGDIAAWAPITDLGIRPASGPTSLGSKSRADASANEIYRSETATRRTAGPRTQDQLRRHHAFHGNQEAPLRRRAA